MEQIIKELAKLGFELTHQEKEFALLHKPGFKIELEKEVD